jgi:hypothetical protein
VLASMWRMGDADARQTAPTLNRLITGRERLKSPMEVCMRRRPVFVPMLLLLTAVFAAPEAQERRVICVLLDDVGFGASDRETSAKLLAVLRDEVVKASDLVGFASTGPLGITADLQPASTGTLNHLMQRLAAAGPSAQSVRPDPSWAAQVTLGTASDLVKNLARLQNRDKQLLLITSRPAGSGSLATTFAQSGQAAPADLTNHLAAIVAAAKAGSVTLRVVSTADPESVALIRALL